MRAAGLLACCLCGSMAVGCAAWLGDIPRLKIDSDDAAEHPVPHAPVSLFVERPEVVDQDEEKDFTPLAEKYSEVLQRRIAEYACARNAFARCSDQPIEGAYRLSSKVIVENFRQGYGGFAGVMLGGMLPPLLGLAWSMPVCGGSCDYRVQWLLHSPAGEQLWQFEGVLGYGLCSCEGDEKVARFLIMALDEALPGMSNIARGAEELADRARAASPAVVAPPAPAPGPGARREVLAVFDIQDVNDRLEKKELLQLTAFLATAMAATGKYTIVPREQLRERLVDEKMASYRQCFDSACQIELGKAVAAEKTLATQLLQVGEECAVVANLYDLNSETASAAAMVQTGCEEKKLMGAMKKVAEQIAAQVE